MRNSPGLSGQEKGENLQMQTMWDHPTFLMGTSLNGKVDTRTKRKPSKNEIQDVNNVMATMINENKLSPTTNPFGFISLANGVLYSVVVAFLLLKGWQNGRSKARVVGSRKKKAAEVEA